MSTSQAMGLFVYTFGAGWVASLLAVPWARISRNFFRMNTGFALPIAAIGAGLWWKGGGDVVGPAAGVGAILLLLVALLYWPDGLARPVLWVASIASMAAVGVATREAGPAIAAVSGGVAMGSVMSTMILGHWYLAGPGLSFDLLVRASKVFLGSLVLRLVVVLAVLAAYQDFGSLGGIASNSSKAVFRSGLLWTRLVAGLVAPLVFAWMVYQCARIKSNQSATGILYATISFVLVGELLAQYYRTQTGVPV